MEGNNDNRNSMLDRMEWPEEEGNDTGQQRLDHVANDDLDEEAREDEERLEDWNFPANYGSISLGNDFTQEPVWRCIKRPWQPKDYQLSPNELSAKKTKEKARAKRELEKLKKPAGDVLDEDEDHEPGDDDSAERFHYYWRLSMPGVCARAGAVGMRWRAIEYPASEPSTMQEEKARVYNICWIKEGQWQKYCAGSVTAKGVLIYRLDDKHKMKLVEGKNTQGIYVNSVLRKGQSKDDLITVVKDLQGDKEFQQEAQKLITDPELVGQKSGNLAFQFGDGTFSYGRGVLEEAPTGDEITARLYVKLRRDQVKSLEVGGGTFSAASGGAFILKTKLEELAGMTSEKDPTSNMLNETNPKAQWRSDARHQTSSNSSGTTSHKAARDDVLTWMRNTHGFAFQFVHKPLGHEAWNKHRKRAINALDEDRGWNRYIDPPIPLYIVPSSEDIMGFMYASIMQAMSDLDMPSGILHEELPTSDKTSLARLPSAKNAKPECATTEVHLTKRSAIAAGQLVKLSTSPFGHYETWITKADWTSYDTARKGRTAPTLLKNGEQISEARYLLNKGTKQGSSGGMGDLEKGLLKYEQEKRNNNKNKKKKKVISAPQPSKTTKQQAKNGKSKGQTQADNAEDQMLFEQEGDSELDKTLALQQIIEDDKTMNLQSSVLFIDVSSSKIRKARGTRGGVKGQAQVMGGSATQIADIFKWTEHNKKAVASTTGTKWPGTSHMPAEWLHRCAYSWGGLSADPLSSQSRKNLIFGTGECNSVMTRYEKAWQALVCREGDRLKQRGGGGLLFANINRDMYSTRFGFDEVPKSNGTQYKVKQPLTSADQVEKLPPWLCYALDYQLLQRDTIDPLHGRKEFKTTFFPWQRGFFTKFEQKLDEAVLDLAYETWERDNPDREVPRSIDNSSSAAAGEGGNGLRRPITSLDWIDDSKPDEVEMDSWRKQAKTEPPRGGGDTSAQDANTSEIEQEEHNDGFSNSQSFAQMTNPKLEQYNGLFYSATNSLVEDADADTGAYASAAAEFAEAAMEEARPEEDDENATANEGEFTQVFGEFGTTHLAKDIDISQTAQAHTITPDTALIAEMTAVWDGVHSSGPTLVDGLMLENAKIVVDISALGSGAQPNEPMINDAESNMPVERAEQDPSDAVELMTRASSSVESDSLEANGESVPAPPQAGDPSQPPVDDGYLKVAHSFSSLSARTVTKKVAAQGLFSPTASGTQLGLEPSEQARQSDGTQRPEGGANDGAPNMFVVQGELLLFGKHKVKLYSLQTPGEGKHLRCDLPADLSLGAFMPSLAGSDLDAIALRNTRVEYRSRGKQAGLGIKTTITLDGMLQPVNTFLRDALGQDRPRIDVTTRLSSSRSVESLKRIPQPLGFTLRGELPEVKIREIFGVLTVTHIGVDVMGRRLGSAGGYELGYGFFGRGHVDKATRVEWNISKFGDQWAVSVYTESSNWKDVAGIEGVDLKDVFMHAAWVGMNLATVRLDLRATFSIKDQAQLMLAGKFGKNDFDVAGYLTNCSLTTLKQLYNQTFKTDIDVTTDHDIVLDELVLVVSKSTGLSLYGKVSVDGHVAGEAGIHIGGGCIEFEGSIDGDVSIGSVKIEEPALAIAIYTSSSSEGSGFEVQFSGAVSVTEKHRFDVLVYLNKRSGSDLEYTLYGSYDGAFYLHDLMDSLKNTDLLRDISMRKLAVCASNMANPGAMIKTKPPGYKIGEGFTVYAEIDVPALGNILDVDSGTPFVVCATYCPPDRFEISIKVPKDDIFEIEGFSVGNLALAVKVNGSLPCIRIGGDLSFPIEDDKKLTLGLGLEAGVYEATGEAELKTPWENPFQLSKKVTISDLKLGLGIAYAGGVPSSVTVGGAVAIGDVKGSVLIHTGADPSKQLLHVKIVNLDVAQLLKTVGLLIEADLALPGGNDAFFIRHFELYLSTGMQLFEEYHPRGVRLQVDMMLFGKHAKLDAEVTTGRVKLQGSVEKFKIGELMVCAASGEDKDPYVDIELSPNVQRLKIDGKITFEKDNWVKILVDIDTAKGTFQLNLEVLVGDALKIIVFASLDGGLPEAVQDRVQEIEDETSSSPEYQSLVKQAGRNFLKQKIGNLPLGGQLEGKTFTVHAEVEDHIVEHLVKIANDLFGDERDDTELGKLEDVLVKAMAGLSAARITYSQAKAESDAAIDKATQSLDRHLSEMQQNITIEQTNKTTQVAKLDQEERNMVLQAAQDERDLVVSEERAALAADVTARKAHADAEEWRVQVNALQAADKEVQTVYQLQTVAEGRLAVTQVTLTRHQQKEPVDGPADPSYEAWKWQRDDLAGQVKMQEVDVKKAIADVKVARLALEGLSMGSVEEATAKLSEITEKMETADAEAEARRAAVAVNIVTAVAKAAERRGDLQKRREAFIAHADARVDELTRKKAAFEQERLAKLKAAHAKYDVGKTEAGKAYAECLEKQRAADVKLRAYKILKDVISKTDEAILTPLRFAVNVVDKASKELLTIESFVLDGSFGGKSSKVAAKVQAKVGGYQYDFSFSIDLSDIVSFFSELWNKIKNVIASVASALLDIARQGLEAVKTFCAEAATEIKTAADVTSEAFLKELAQHEREVQGFLDGIDRSVLQPFKLAAEQVAEQALKDLDDSLDQVARSLPREVIEAGQEIDDFLRNPGRSIGDQIFNELEGLGRGIGLLGGPGSASTGPRQGLVMRSEESLLLTPEVVLRQEREAEELMISIMKSKIQLEELNRTGMIGREQLENKQAEIEILISDIKVRELQNSIQKIQMKAEEAERAGRPVEDLVKMQEELLEMRNQARKMAAETKIKRGRMEIEAIHRSGEGQDDIEKADIEADIEADLARWTDQIELSDLRRDLDRANLEMRAMESTGKSRDELQLESLKLTQAEGVFRLEVEKRELRRLQGRMLKEVKMMERRGAADRDLELRRLQLRELELLGTKVEVQAKLEDAELDMNMDTMRLHMQRGPREAEIGRLSTKLAMSGKCNSLRRQGMQVQLEMQDLDIRRMEIVGADRQDIEAKKAARRREGIIFNEIEPFGHDVERLETELRIMEMQGSDPAELERMRRKLEEMAADYHRKEREVK